MKNALKKRVALKRAMEFVEDTLERVEEEFGRDSPQFRGLDDDLGRLRALGLDLEVIRGESEKDRYLHEVKGLVLWLRMHPIDHPAAGNHRTRLSHLRGWTEEGQPGRFRG